MIRYADYRPLGAARDLFRRRESEVVLSGPAGTGKSRAVLEKLHACAEKYAGSRQLILRKTRASLTNTGLVTYTQLVLPSGNAEVNYQGATYPNGSVIDFGGIDKASKIMSSEYDIIYVQEATELTEDDWEKLTTRLRWHKLPYQQMLGDVNPAAPTHWLKRRANDGKLVMLESRHEDNPTLWDRTAGAWLPEGIDYISKLDALSGARRDRLRYGKWAAAEGQVYDAYDAAVHLVPRFDIPREWLRIWSVDFGFSNPFVWQAWALDRDGRLWRYREIYRTQRIVEDHVKDIIRAAHKEPCPVAIICDHDAEDRATLERHLGAATGAAFKSISPGVQAVQQRLRVAGDGKPRLFLMRDSLVERDESLHKRKLPVCTEEEIESYVWPKNESGAMLKESPTKMHDHGMDAMRYLVAYVDSIAIEPNAQSGVLVYDDRVEISPY